MKKYVSPFVLLFFIACAKGSSGEKDREAPVVSLNTPVHNEIFTGGQNIMITGTVTDNKYIEEIHIEITNLVTAAEYLHVHIHPAARSFNFSQALTIQPGISYKIRVIADDASSNSAVKSADITCN
ncbi:MAG: hypothetical protein JNK14_11630 [Chitinophagaceae bacterium]|nr:hypothetical protein [Chitinophagaceae bacterium]